MLSKSSIPMSPWVDTENASNKTSIHYKRVIQRNRISNTDIYHKVVLLLWGTMGTTSYPVLGRLCSVCSVIPEQGVIYWQAPIGRSLYWIISGPHLGWLVCLSLAHTCTKPESVAVSRLIAPKVLVPRTLFYPPESLLFSTSCSSTTRLVIY